MPKRLTRNLPTRQEILDFIATSATPVGKREIARAFKVAPAHRVALKGLLKDIERSGEAERGHKRRLAVPGALPEITVIEIIAVDLDGEVTARPLAAAADDPSPKIVVLENRLGGDEIGQRAVAKLARLADGSYEARIIRLLSGAAERVLGVFRRHGEGGRIEPTDRKIRTEYRVTLADSRDAHDGELVLAEVTAARRLGLPQARVLERLGDTADPRTISLIAIHSHDIPTAFPPEALAQAEAASPVTLEGRTDLRAVPLVTIDGADARDFDDAVWAEPDDDPANPGGWHILVAIADVSWYVRPGDALDRAASERGNSVYFPDRVVPMLPEALSNELCSLKPDVPRACLAVHMWLDADGHRRRHRFERGLMRSAARLTYEEVQAARDGYPDARTTPLLASVIEPLYGAYAALETARRQRGTLDLDLPERRVVLGRDGGVLRIEKRQRLDSHRLIEEFMIAANVAAAETLEKMRQPCMYRIHDAPDPAKLDALRDFLGGLEDSGLHLARGQVVKPRHFTQLLHRAAGTPYAPLINELVLRSQAQAAYSPENIGHFGLALRRYAHFTSPIRRYADLLVHRALVAGHNAAGTPFGEGGLPAIEHASFQELGDRISKTERRAAAAERSAVDRYTAAFLADRVGATFHGRINGVTRFGLFVTLDDSGADGLVPMRSLPDDFYVHDEAQHRLVGRRRGRVFRLGDSLTVRLETADGVTGSLTLSLLGEGDAAIAGMPRSPKKNHRQTTRERGAARPRTGRRRS
ncbi:MAG: ribonuclease R [Alphaproteobacteria bacterium]|nr:ribonuclease R [Alphaproteobacteria bacterium]